MLGYSAFSKLLYKIANSMFKIFMQLFVFFIFRIIIFYLQSFFVIKMLNRIVYQKIKSDQQFVRFFVLIKWAYEYVFTDRPIRIAVRAGAGPSDAPADEVLRVEEPATVELTRNPVR